MVKSWHLLVPRINLKLIPFSPSCPISILISCSAICNGSAGRRENWPAGPDPFQTLKMSAREKLGGFITGWIRVCFCLRMIRTWEHGESSQDVLREAVLSQCVTLREAAWTISAPHNNYHREQRVQRYKLGDYSEKANEKAILTNRSFRNCLVETLFYEAPHHLGCWAWWLIKLLWGSV